MCETSSRRRGTGRPDLSPSIIGTAVIGGVGVGIWGKVRDKGLRDEDLKAADDSLQPGTSAIIAIAEERMIERLQGGLERNRSIARHTVSAEAAAQIVAEEGRPPLRPQEWHGGVHDTTS
jgi:uncharacterized membrane protein